MTNNGWIKLHRSMLDWEWYSDLNVFRLFTHCLLRANHAEKKWQGKVIKRGSFWTSLETLSSETGLSIRQIRTAFDKLESTGELTSSRQARGRMVTIHKYDSYQSDDKLDDSQMTIERQADDKLPTANKNDKNEKNDKKNIAKPSSSPDSVESVNQIFIDGGVTKDQVSEIRKIRKDNKGGKITERVAKTLLIEFQKAGQQGWSLEAMLNEWATRSWKSFKADWIRDRQQLTSQERNAERNRLTFDLEHSIKQLDGL